MKRINNNKNKGMKIVIILINVIVFTLFSSMFISSGCLGYDDYTNAIISIKVSKHNGNVSMNGLITDMSIKSLGLMPKDYYKNLANKNDINLGVVGKLRYTLDSQYRYAVDNYELNPSSEKGAIEGKAFYPTQYQHRGIGIADIGHFYEKIKEIRELLKKRHIAILNYSQSNGAENSSNGISPNYRDYSVLDNFINNSKNGFPNGMEDNIVYVSNLSTLMQNRKIDLTFQNNFKYTFNQNGRIMDVNLYKNVLNKSVYTAYLYDLNFTTSKDNPYILYPLNIEAYLLDGAYRIGGVHFIPIIFAVDVDNNGTMKYYMMLITDATNYVMTNKLSMDIIKVYVDIQYIKIKYSDYYAYLITQQDNLDFAHNFAKYVENYKYLNAIPYDNYLIYSFGNHYTSTNSNTNNYHFYNTTYINRNHDFSKIRLKWIEWSNNIAVRGNDTNNTNQSSNTTLNNTDLSNYFFNSKDISYPYTNLMDIFYISQYGYDYSEYDNLLNNYENYLGDKYYKATYIMPRFYNVRLNAIRGSNAYSDMFNKSIYNDNTLNLLGEKIENFFKQKEINAQDIYIIPISYMNMGYNPVDVSTDAKNMGNWLLYHKFLEMYVLLNQMYYYGYVKAEQQNPNISENNAEQMGINFVYNLFPYTLMLNKYFKDNKGFSMNSLVQMDYNSLINNNEYKGAMMLYLSVFYGDIIRDYKINNVNVFEMGLATSNEFYIGMVSSIDTDIYVYNLPMMEEFRETYGSTLVFLNTGIYNGYIDEMTAQIDNLKKTYEQQISNLTKKFDNEIQALNNALINTQHQLELANITINNLTIELQNLSAKYNETLSKYLNLTNMTNAIFDFFNSMGINFTYTSDGKVVFNIYNYVQKNSVINGIEIRNPNIIFKDSLSDGMYDLYIKLITMNVSAYNDANLTLIGTEMTSEGSYLDDNYFYIDNITNFIEQNYTDYGNGKIKFYGYRFVDNSPNLLLHFKVKVDTDNSTQWGFVVSVLSHSKIYGNYTKVEKSFTNTLILPKMSIQSLYYTTSSNSVNVNGDSLDTNVDNYNLKISVKDSDGNPLPDGFYKNGKVKTISIDDNSQYIVKFIITIKRNVKYNIHITLYDTNGNVVLTKDIYNFSLKSITQSYNPNEVNNMSIKELDEKKVYYSFSS